MMTELVEMSAVVEGSNGAVDTIAAARDAVRRDVSFAESGSIDVDGEEGDGYTDEDCGGEGE